MNEEIFNMILDESLDRVVEEPTHTNILYAECVIRMIEEPCMKLLYSRALSNLVDGYSPFGTPRRTLPYNTCYHQEGV